MLGRTNRNSHQDKLGFNKLKHWTHSPNSILKSYRTNLEKLVSYKSKKWSPKKFPNKSLHWEELSISKFLLVNFDRGSVAAKSYFQKFYKIIYFIEDWGLRIDMYLFHCNLNDHKSRAHVLHLTFPLTIFIKSVKYLNH